jgi:TatD DNase family protein
VKSQIIDTHAHLDMKHFNKDRSEVIARAQAAGVSTIINPAVDLMSSRTIIELSRSQPQIFAAVGFHPHEVSNVTRQDIESLNKLADNPRVVAIGETGLDFYRNRAPQEKQISVLTWQLELAANLKLPIIIHCRQAEREMLPLLQKWVATCPYPNGQARGVIHCFGGDTATARRYLDMGFYISLGGYITYPSSVRQHNTIRNIPWDRLLLETDCPYLPPQAHRSERNEPSYLPLTLNYLARVRSVTPAVVAGKTTENAHSLFRLPES